MSSEISKVNQHQHNHKKHHQSQKDKENETAPTSSLEKNNLKSSQENTGNNVNYISIGMKRFKELAFPVINSLNSLNPSQRRMALLAVGIIFFWPLLLLALNLPWILVAGSSIYAYYFGTRKLYSDANEAVKDHLSVDVEAKGREVQLKFERSQFPGKEALLSSLQFINDLCKVAYKTFLLASMTVLDYLVTLLLNFARSAKNLATTANANVSESENN